MPDGDLWEVYVTLLRQRGEHSVRVTKIKAHTKAIDIEKGIITKVQQVGNAKADTIANRGATRSDSNIVKLAHAYKARQLKYAKFLEIIHGIILRVLAAFRVKRNFYAKAHMLINKGKQQITGPSQWTYPKRCEGSKVDLRALPGDLSICDQNIYGQIWCFIDHLIIVPTGESGNGVTWLELFAKFEGDGGLMPSTKPKGKLSVAKCSFRLLLAAFKRHVRFVLSLCASEELLMFFSPCRVPGRRLEGFALATHTASVNFLPCWADDAQARMYRAMLSLRAAPTANVCKKAEEGGLFLASRKISYRGVPPWRKCNAPTQFIPNWMHKWQQDYMQSVSTDAYTAVGKGRPKAFWISCPECGFWTDVCKVALLRRGRWRAVPCANCNGNRAASRWKCVCDKRWAACETHSCIGRTCGVRTHLKVQTPKRVMPSCFDVDSESRLSYRQDTEDQEGQGLSCFGVPAFAAGGTTKHTTIWNF